VKLLPTVVETVHAVLVLHVLTVLALLIPIAVMAHVITAKDLSVVV